MPSRTPATWPRNSRERTQAAATRDTSTPTFMAPNFTGATWQMASTTPSPAMVATPAVTSS